MTKKLTTLVFALLMTIVVALPATAQKKVTNAQRAEYVLKHIGVKKDVKAKLKVLLLSYLKDKDEAESVYDSLKDKLKPRIKLGNLSEEQAQQLLDAKWVAAEKELVVKKAYEKKFKTILSTRKTYECFSLLNDKKSKILGQDNDDD